MKQIGSDKRKPTTRRIVAYAADDRLLELKNLTRTFAIITTCKNRLEHLKVSLPSMVAQGCREVIVVDFSCPAGTADYVARNFPSVRVVSVAGQEFFSNWKARNAGSSVAKADVLVFVDADTTLAEDAVKWLSNNLPAQAFGCFTHKVGKGFNKTEVALSNNQMSGFHVIPAAEFRRIGGYDEVLEGYGSGADTDLLARLGLIPLVSHLLDPCVVESIIEHDLPSRVQHHSSSIRTSYCAGLLYRAAKLVLLKIRRDLELDLAWRRQIYATAVRAASGLASGKSLLGMSVLLKPKPVLMPRQLGYERGTTTVSLRIEVSLEGRLTETEE
jgi:glycosyltransferase involved in cell wall biosynthesis